MGDYSWRIMRNGYQDPVLGNKYTSKEKAEADIQRLVKADMQFAYFAAAEIPNYHSDWNALMPVVERIGIEIGQTFVGAMSWLNRYNKITSIETLHLAVYKYLNKNS